MKNKTKLYLILGFVLICIMAFILIMARLVKVNSECVQDPFIYAAKTVVDEKGNPNYMLCECDVLAKGTFYFDQNGIYENNPLTNSLELP